MRDRAVVWLCTARWSPGVAACCVAVRPWCDPPGQPVSTSSGAGDRGAEVGDGLVRADGACYGAMTSRSISPRSSVKSKRRSAVPPGKSPMSRAETTQWLGSSCSVPVISVV